jgi:hypothetical protein
MMISGKTPSLCKGRKDQGKKESKNESGNESESARRNSMTGKAGE